MPARGGRVPAVTDAQSRQTWKNGQVTQATEDPESRVYLIGGADSNVAKIGTSGDVVARLRGLQNGSPVRLYVLATALGDWTLERALHRHFENHRLHGEWFDFGTADRVTAFGLAVALLKPEIDKREAARIARIRESHVSLANLEVEDDLRAGIQSVLDRIEAQKGRPWYPRQRKQVGA